MRIAIAGITYEGLNFSPVRARMKDFRVLRGDEVLEYPGLAGIVESLGIGPVTLPVAVSLAPSGVIEEDFYLQLRGEILAGLAGAGKVDGVCLLMHGAMLVENIWSGEEDLVRHIRALLGYDVPICGRLDLHGNVSQEFANKTDIWVGKRTAPHRDAQETTERAFRLLADCVRFHLRPRPVYIHLPLLLQGEKATTRIEPMRSLIAQVEEIERQPGILTAGVHVGFGWADAPHAGSSVVVIAESEEHLPLARQEARCLAQTMWDRREEFTFDQEVAASIDEAIDRALGAPERTVFLTDSGDNPTAGAPGDATGFLSRLLEREVPDAIFASIPDPEAAEACFEAGVGATVRLSLGGKMDSLHGDPVGVTGTVEHLYRPPEEVKGAAMATVQAGGVWIIVTDIRKAFTTLADFRNAGLEPLEHKVVVVKLGYLMPELRDAAPREILVLSPGYADMDLTRLPYKYVTRPIFPLDTDFAWHPVITNVAGYGG